MRPPRGAKLATAASRVSNESNTLLRRVMAKITFTHVGNPHSRTSPGPMRTRLNRFTSSASPVPSMTTTPLRSITKSWTPAASSSPKAP